MESKTIWGIVRHYWTAQCIADETTNPDNFYRKNGIHYYTSTVLKTATDLEEFKHDPIWEILRDMPDGEEVEITIKAKGKSQCAKGFVWTWVNGDYQRIPEQDFKKMVESEISNRIGKGR